MLPKLLLNHRTEPSKFEGDFPKRVARFDCQGDYEKMPPRPLRLNCRPVLVMIAGGTNQRAALGAG